MTFAAGLFHSNTICWAESCLLPNGTQTANTILCRSIIPSNPRPTTIQPACLPSGSPFSILVKSAKINPRNDSEVGGLHASRSQYRIITSPFPAIPRSPVTKTLTGIHTTSTEEPASSTAKSTPVLKRRFVQSRSTTRSVLTLLSWT